MNVESPSSPADDCPSDDMLRQSMAGSLTVAEAEAVARHLELCERCANQLSSRLEAGGVETAESTGIDAEHPQVAGLIDRLRMAPLPLAGLRNGAGSLSGNDLPDRLPADVLELLDEPQSTDEIGRLGDYRILRFVGQGGMGIVFEAVDASQRHVALKLMRPHLAADPHVRARFLSEARSMAAVRHENIVRILHIGEAGHVPCLAMEFLNGESLARRMRQGPALTLDEIIRAGTGIARGLAAAHAQGLIHRDVKPDNVHLVPATSAEAAGAATSSFAPGAATRRQQWRTAADDDAASFEIRLLDFGLASSSSEARSEGRRNVAGTPAFMSPEQACGEEIDERSDLFGLGCILYRLVTGRLPYEGETPVETLVARQTQDPPPVQGLAPAIPDGLARLINGLLAGSPDRRPATAQAVADLLEQMRPRRRFFNRRRAVAALITCSTVVLATVFLVPQLRERLPFRNDRVAPIESATVVPDSMRSAPTSQAPASMTTDPAPDGDSPMPPVAAAVDPANPPPAAFPPLDPTWLAGIGGLTPEERVAQVITELRHRNPEFDGTYEQKSTATLVQELWLRSRFIADLTPVSALPELKLLFCIGTPEEDSLIEDLSPLRGMKLRYIDLGYSGIHDLSPLAGMPLQNVKLVGSKVSSIEPLRSMTLVELQLGGSQIDDLAPIQGMPLQILSVWGSRVSDLSPLRGCTTLDWLEIQHTQVRDLSPLRGTPVRRLDCTGLEIDDWTALAELPLEELHLTYAPARHRDVLLKISSLRKINYMPVAEVLKPGT